MRIENCLKIVRICGVLSILVFAFGLMSIPAASSAVVDRMRQLKADEWYIEAADGFSKFMWTFGGVQAALAALSIVFSSIALGRLGGTPGAAGDGRGSH